MIFNVIIKKDEEDGGYNVSCPALPGCHSQGETTTEALENIKDAILGCIKVLNERVKITNQTDEIREVEIYG